MGKRNKTGWKLEKIMRNAGKDTKHCALCGAKKDLTVHHIDGDCGNNDVNNLQTLCRTCHVRHHKLLAEDWRDFQQKMGIKF